MISPAERLPEWIRKKGRADLHATKHLLRRHGVKSVCEEARCPNRGECFARPAASFMILGDRCTRNCPFCAVSPGTPGQVDPEEPENVAAAVKEMALSHVVITSVTRDDLSDRGAMQFARTIAAVRRQLPGVTIEVLTPDFGGDEDLLAAVLGERPHVFNHNLETVARLYPAVRPGADYRRSLRLLEAAKSLAPRVTTKSGLMVGLGESRAETEELLGDLRAAGCDMVTIGQYLRPTKKNLPVVEYITPRVFDELREKALDLGFYGVASGPFVRSSMNAEEMYRHG